MTATLRPDGTDPASESALRLLLAGDDFVRNDILVAALRMELPDMPVVRALTLPWPQVPFGAIGEVDEASGSEEELAAAIGDAEVVITQMAALTSRVLSQAPKLRLVVCTRGGPVNVNVRAAADRGIAVACTPGRNAVAAAEYTVLLILAAMRKLANSHTATAAGEWRSAMYAYAECGIELAGSTVGVVGLGEIGRRVATLLSGLGASVVGYDPFVDSSDVAIELLPLEDLLRRSNVLTLHARLTPETKGMIGNQEIALLPRGAVLVNTARGGLLDYNAAAGAVADGQLGGIALDVYPTEPVAQDFPLLTAANVVLSPHLAGATRQTAERAAAMAAAEVRRYLAGEPLAYVVNGVTLEPRR
jgi:D-3-phosphoglycerate dehydrogenase